MTSRTARPGSSAASGRRRSMTCCLMTSQCSAVSRNCWRSSPTSPRVSRRVPDDSQDEHARSSDEYLRTYLAFLDTERAGTPDRFARQLRSVLERYDVRSLARTPELEQALLRMYRSAERIPAAAPIVITILDRWRRARGALASTMDAKRLAVLDRLISSTQGRHQDVCELAQGRPLLLRRRAAAQADARPGIRGNRRRARRAFRSPGA